QLDVERAVLDARLHGPREAHQGHRPVGGRDVHGATHALNPERAIQSTQGQVARSRHPDPDLDRPPFARGGVGALGTKPTILALEVDRFHQLLRARGGIGARRDAVDHTDAVAIPSDHGHAAVVASVNRDRAAGPRVDELAHVARCLAPIAPFAVKGLGPAPVGLGVGEGVGRPLIRILADIPDTVAGAARHGEQREDQYGRRHHGSRTHQRVLPLRRREGMLPPRGVASLDRGMPGKVGGDPAWSRRPRSAPGMSTVHPAYDFGWIPTVCFARIPRPVRRMSFARQGGSMPSSRCKALGLALMVVLVGCEKREVPSRTGMIDVPGGKVWYQIVGSGPKTPLLLLHGGPGVPSYYLKPLAALADERPVVFYDQLGCGRSPAPADSALWTTERFVQELA